MELGLTLGESTSTPFTFMAKNVSDRQNSNGSLKNSDPSNKIPILGLGFCMGLGISSDGRPQEEEQQKEDVDAAAADDHSCDEDDEHEHRDDDDDDDDDAIGSPLQLDLLPLVPVPRTNSTLTLPTHRWSSENGSSENGSSENVGQPAAMRFDVNRQPAAGGGRCGGPTDEVTSSNSLVMASFQMDLDIFIGSGSNSEKRRGAGNDAVEVERGGGGGEGSRGSDEDENGVNGKKKLRLSKQQSAFLEDSFKEHHTLNPKQKLALAKQLNLRPRQVEVWFQNRRARTKLKQTEVDYEYLKRCCETLTEENKRLHKELQEIRALKTSNPFYMQVPPTTLTMCPSCERVATTSTPPQTTTTSLTASTANQRIATTASAAISTPKGLPFPLSRPTRLFPLSQANHPL